MTTGNEARRGLRNAGTASETGEKTLLQTTEAIQRSVELSRHHEQPPTQVPGLKIQHCLGEGAFGSVWLARETNTGKQVAVKFYTHQRGLDWSLLNREVEKLAVLYTSRNIIGLLDVGWDSDPPYYVMEYLENGSLASHLAEGPLPVQEAVRIAKSVLQALVHAHGSGILHCDLKPANVLLDSDYAPRLCDFGQSRLSNEQNPALGTLFYMAPEQADLKAVPNARWDVYALGALLYHMLCGEAPFRTPANEEQIRSAETLEERLAIYRKLLNESPKPSLHRRVTGVDRRLAEIVDRCLEINPKKRFPNAQTVLDQLEARDRQRSRRPMLTLGIIGPTLLVLAILPIAGNAMRNAVQTAENNLMERALESDALTARILARSIERELAARMSELVELADDPQLRAAVMAAQDANWSNREAVNEIMDQSKQRVNDKRLRQNRELDTSWFLVDERGYQRWRQPYDANTYDKRFRHRDYFHGRNVEFSENDVPEDIAPIEVPHVSVAFRSDATDHYMVAVSVPIRDPENDEVIGLLARTTHLERLLRQYEPSIRVQGRNEVDRVIALIDQRDWKILDHPWMTEQNLYSLSDEQFETLLTLKQNPQLIEKLKRLQDYHPNHELARGHDREANYLDPVGQVEPSEFGGEWLAAFWPIGETGWLAVVQERKDEALNPVGEMEAELIRYGLWGLFVSCALIGLLWYFVNRASSERGLKPWTRGTSRSWGTATSTVTDR